MNTLMYTLCNVALLCEKTMRDGCLEGAGTHACCLHGWNHRDDRGWREWYLAAATRW